MSGVYFITNNENLRLIAQERVRELTDRTPLFTYEDTIAKETLKLNQAIMKSGSIIAYHTPESKRQPDRSSKGISIFENSKSKERGLH